MPRSPTWPLVYPQGNFLSQEGSRLASHKELGALLYPLSVIFLLCILEELGVSSQGKIPAGHMASGIYAYVSNPALGKSMRTELIPRGTSELLCGRLL